MSPFRDLAPHEAELHGRWHLPGDGRSGDDVEQRIRWLVANRLVAEANASDGWEWLFRDPSDGRLWELSFPEGSLHGSGPRRLAVIVPEAAKTKYDVR